LNNIVNIKAAQYEPPVLIHYVQGSTEIPLEFNITDYEIPSGSTARIYIKRPDNTESYNDCTISGNVITYKPTAQFFSVAGICTGQLQIMIGDDFLVTFPLLFDVAENIIDDSAIESSNEYGALEALLQEAQENIPAAGEAAEAANQAAQSANNAANAANQAAGTARQAATAATNAAGSANTAAGSANKAATAATTAATQANKAKEDADEAADAANLAANQAMLKQVAYYNNNYQDILETAIDGSMLVAISATNNAELYEALGSFATWVWVYQFFFQTPSATGQRVQIAFARDTNGSRSRVAYRTYVESSGFTPWALVNNDLLLPDGGSQNNVLIKGANGPVWDNDLVIGTLEVAGVEHTITSTQYNSLMTRINTL
jgi:hypothetical protein